jgi:hypothetical protein
MRYVTAGASSGISKGHPSHAVCTRYTGRQPAFTPRSRHACQDAAALTGKLPMIPVPAPEVLAPLDLDP